MTVAQALAAHASAQIAAARVADEAHRRMEETGQSLIEEAPPSFVETWGCESTVIGFARVE